MKFTSLVLVLRCSDLEGLHISDPCHHSAKDPSSDSSVDCLHSTCFRGVQTALFILESIPGTTELSTVNFLGFVFHGKYCIALPFRHQIIRVSSKDLAQTCQSPYFKNSMKTSGISLVSNKHLNILKLSV